MNVSPCTMLRDWLVANFQVEGVGANEAPGAAGRASDVRNLWAQQFDEQMANYDDPEAAEELKNALLRGLGSQETRPLAAVITSLVNAPPFNPPGIVPYVDGSVLVIDEVGIAPTSFTPIMQIHYTTPQSEDSA